MDIIAIIPARYGSTRFPGKPLAEICGKPMLWWVYNQVRKVEEFRNVVAAVDDHRLIEVCEEHGIPYILTKNDHPEHISRIHEVSEKIKADVYVCVNGDEPLISPECIRTVINRVSASDFFTGARRILSDPAETNDPANIKLVITDNDRCIYMSRFPVPFPKGSLMFKYNKYVGIECFSKEALDFFVATPQGKIEKIEDIDHLRFIEHNKPLRFIEVDSESISVDTPKDLEKVRLLMQEKPHA